MKPMLRRKALALLLLFALVTTTIPVMVVVAQEPAPATPIAPEITFGWVVLAWILYAIAGILSSLSSDKELFDSKKLAKSLFIMILTGFIAIALHLTPGAVETQFGGLLDVIATFVLNTGPGVSLIYTLDKLYQLIMNTKAKIEAAHALAAAIPEPKKP